MSDHSQKIINLAIEYLNLARYGLVKQFDGKYKVYPMNIILDKGLIKPLNFAHQNIDAAMAVICTVLSIHFNEYPQDGNRSSSRLSDHLINQFDESINQFDEPILALDDMTIEELTAYDVLNSLPVN